MSLFEPNQDPSQVAARQRWKSMIALLGVVALIFALFYVLGIFS
jgi:hypothetical protein